MTKRYILRRLCRSELLVNRKSGKRTVHAGSWGGQFSVTPATAMSADIAAPETTTTEEDVLDVFRLVSKCERKSNTRGGSTKLSSQVLCLLCLGLSYLCVAITHVCSVRHQAGWCRASREYATVSTTTHYRVSRLFNKLLFCRLAS